MNLRTILAATLVTASMAVMSDAAFAYGPSSHHSDRMTRYSSERHDDRHARPGRHERVRFIRVHRGDTLSKIAWRYRTTVYRLKRLNHLHGSTIYVGQLLRVG